MNTRFQKVRTENGEGIILSIKQVGNGSRRVTLFTRGRGQVIYYIMKSALKRYGTGCLAPFAYIRYTAVKSGDMILVNQYEGRLLFDMMDMPYEDIVYWYFVSEVAEKFYPPENEDNGAFEILLMGALANRDRNHRICAFITAVKLLSFSGFDPVEEEPMRRFKVDQSVMNLLAAMRDYDWRKTFPVKITRTAMRKAEDYINAFIAEYCDTEMKIRL